MTLEDLRGQGPPGDIGTFQMPTDILVFKHTFSGVTYAVATRRGDRGWVLVDVQAVANIAAVINNSFAALTIGRTWKEKVTVIGYFTDVGQIVSPSYVLLELIGSLTAVAGLNASFVVNSTPLLTNVEIEISGGTWDVNKGNQAQDCSTIFFNNVINGLVWGTRIIGGHRYTALRGEGIEFYACGYCIASHNIVIEADYDGIKLRAGCEQCIVIANTIDVPATSGSSGIQIGTNISILNVVCDNTVWVHGSDTAAGLKMDAPERTVVCHNTVRGTAVAGIEIISCNYNVVCDNYFKDYLWGINFRQAPGPNQNVAQHNCIYMRATASIGIRMVNGVGNVLEENKIFGTGANSTGISIGAGVSATLLHRNDFLGTWGTRLTDAGTDTVYDSIVIPFTVGTEGTITGFNVDAAAEYAYAWGYIPSWVHQVCRIKVYAKSNVAEADGMDVTYRVYGGADNEDFQTHDTGALADIVSYTTNFGATDIIHWRLTHAQILALTAGDSFSLSMVGQVAVGVNCATSCRFRTIEIEYI